MSRSLPFKPSAITSALGLAWVAAACGHTSLTLDAYDNAKNGRVTTSTGGQTSSTGGAANSSGGSAPTSTEQFSCTAVRSQQFDPNFMQAYSEAADVTDNVDRTLSAMGQVEKASQMIGVPVGNMDYFDIERSPDVDVPGKGTIRGYNYRDAGRGVNLDAGQKNAPTDGKDYSTVFPAASIRAASWDMALEKKVGEASGDETAASLNNMLLAPCMNIIRHPYWGRTQETYGEDTYHTGRMATAYTVGLQEYVTGCAKHFAANNVEKNRSSQNAIMNEQTLREVYARHFEMVVQDGGVGCIMASYNKINGKKNTQNKHLLRDILKAPVEQGGMGYQGLVLSDWWAMPGDQQIPSPSDAQGYTTEAVEAGLDIEVPWTLHYSTDTLGKADQTLVTDAARRVLRQKYRFKTALNTDGWSIKPPVSVMTGHSIDSADHQALAEEVAIHSAVLVQNGTGDTPVLPLKDAAKNIAVIGPEETFSLVSSSVPKSCVGAPQRGPCTYHFATDPALGDRGSARVNGDPDKSIGPFQGIKDAAGSSRTVTNGNSATAAAGADTIVVVVGYTPGDEGEEYAINEGGDRHTLDLPPGQNDFVTAALDLMKPTIIVIESGSIVNLPWLKHANKNQATVWAGYGGIRGGSALGKLLFAVNGANFSGKVPLAWPTQAELDQAPFKDNDPDGTRMGYFFGYREYDRRKAAGANVDLVYPFGHGLSYSSFKYSNLMVPCQGQMASKEAVVDVTVDIENTSAVDGEEVAMLFIKPPAKPAGITGDRPVKELKSFAKVAVKAGAKVTAHLPVRIRDLRRWEGAENGKWVTDTGAYTILVGKDAADADAGANMGTLTIQGD
ncbi:MAG TPA: glycoside hydrolase family 3 N-terminal domain-containing protein [Polyangiaceae bacterium]|nr:glycoside hydrolase family 3 N-terminal domain-containing protein [Polyangiaceae bacterium]